MTVIMATDMIQLDKLEFDEVFLREYVGAVCDRPRAHTVRPYDVNC